MKENKEKLLEQRASLQNLAKLEKMKKETEKLHQTKHQITIINQKLRTIWQQEHRH